MGGDCSPVSLDLSIIGPYGPLEKSWQLVQLTQDGSSVFCAVIPCDHLGYSVLRCLQREPHVQHVAIAHPGCVTVVRMNGNDMHVLKLRAVVV